MRRSNPVPLLYRPARPDHFGATRPIFPNTYSVRATRISSTALSGAIPEFPRMAEFETRLTRLAHGGGCGCKLSPAVLRELLSGMPTMQAFPDLLVGIETGDDAAVYRINDEQAIVATTDFFMPIVDDARDFGRIAAANALSAVYAMGGRPLLALAILGMPLGKLAPGTVREIIAGVASICSEAGLPLARGHPTDATQPIHSLPINQKGQASDQ